MPRYSSERSVFDKLGLQYGKLECELRDLIYDYEDEVEMYKLQMAKIKRLQQEIDKEKQQGSAQGTTERKRRGRISGLIRKLTLIEAPKEPDIKAFLQNKKAIEGRMAVLMKQNAQLLAFRCIQRMN